MEKNENIQYVLGLLRLAMGWIFLWAFLDKLLGLGYTTKAADAWLAGGSPTYGFLKHGSSGPLEGIFQAIAGQGLVDYAFMMGLLLIGIALLAGIAMKLATIGGVTMMMLMYLAVLPPEHNILVDDHIVYSLVLIILYLSKAGHYMGIGKEWESAYFVKKNPCLK